VKDSQLAPVGPRPAPTNLRTYGPEFTWLAWHPVDTRDRGWRWLRLVRRRRVWLNMSSARTVRWWEHHVT
jgi:hypothetical protein